MSTQLVYLLNQNTPVIVTGGLNPTGAYNAGTTYAKGDSFDYLGSSYVVFNPPVAGTTPPNTTYYEVLANKGDTGATGSVTANSGTIIWGDGVTDGSWQITISGSNLSIQRLESGVWVEKTAVTP